MIQIQQDIQLKALNTLHLSAVATHYVEVDSIEALKAALEFAKAHQLNIMVLSGGSNMLLPEKINALVLHMQIKGIDLLEEDDTTKTYRVGAGQVWHDFVLWTTQNRAFGLQNLALIPGLVGASPVQNIGAYGVEVGEFIQNVEVYDRHTQSVQKIKAEDCHFSYRHSIFKDDPQRYVITHVVFKLLKQPKLKISYGDLKAAIGDDQSPENLQQQVIKIRQSKLPDPKEYPNVGSFFKNPIISSQAYEKMQESYPKMPHYAQADGSIKIAAGWLIDQTGWKGKRIGSVGMFERQALVLVNYADANLQSVQTTYRAVQQDVVKKFNIRLEPEPVLYNEQGLIQTH